MTTKNISRFAWQMSRLAAWGDRHEVLADIIVAVLMALVFGSLFYFALHHDAIWYDGLTEAQRYAAGGY